MSHHLLCRQTLFPSVLTRSFHRLGLLFLTHETDLLHQQRVHLVLLFGCVFFIVIFIPNEILGKKKSYSLKTRTYKRTWYGKGLGVVNGKSSTSTVSKMMIVMRSSQMWETPRYSSTIDSITRAPKKMHYHYQCTNFTSIEQKIRLFLKNISCGQISKKKKY